jgi:hypothetical protein
MKGRRRVVRLGGKVAQLTSQDPADHLALSRGPGDARLASVAAMVDQDLGQVGQPRHRRRPGPQLEILGEVERRIVAQAVRAHEGGAHHHRRVHEGRPKEERGGHVVRVGPVADVTRSKAWRGKPDRSRPRAADADAGIPLEELDLTGQPGRVADVVGVHPGDEGATDQVEPLVQGGADPPMAGLADETDTRIAERPDDRHAVVGGTVVDDDELEVGQGLDEHALDGRGQMRGAVQDGHEDADPRQWHAGESGARRPRLATADTLPCPAAERCSPRHHPGRRPVRRPSGDRTATLTRVTGARSS